MIRLGLIAVDERVKLDVSSSLPGVYARLCSVKSIDTRFFLGGAQNYLLLSSKQVGSPASYPTCLEPLQ